MKAPHIPRKLVFTLLLVGLSQALAQQDRPASAPSGAETQDIDFRTLIAQALDQNTDLAVDDQPLVQAFEQISRQTGLPVELDPESLELLPYGGETRVSLTIKGYPLREGLGRLIAPIGMTFEVLSDKVLVHAHPALGRMGRRASWEELALLERVIDKPLADLADDLKFQFRVDTDEGARDRLLAKAKSVGAGTAAEVLDVATEAFGWTWQPAGSQILIVSRRQETLRRLQTLCTLQYQRRNLGEILTELGSLAGVNVVFDPAAIMKLPVNTREAFSLLAENVTVQQAFDLICGNTGLRYEVAEEAVRFLGPDAQADQPVTPAGSSQPYVGKVTVRDDDNNLVFEFFVRESDLPGELNKLRKEKIRQAIEAMQKAYE